MCFLQNIHYLQKKTFFTEKNINENVKYIYLISEIYFYTKNVCATNINLSEIYTHSAKKVFLIIKNVFVKTSLQTQ